MSSPPYIDLNTFLRKRFGCRVQKISLDAGLGCPNRDGRAGTGGCIYCNRLGSGTGAASRQSLEEQIDFGKRFLRKRYKAEKFIAYFQSFSNTYAPVDELESLYRRALAVPDVVGLAIGTRPDCVPDEVLDMIARLNREAYVYMEYGLQSSHDRTLQRINRGHDYRTFLDALDHTRARGIDVCVHVILGLPGETGEDMLETARAVAGLDIQGIKIHLLYVSRGTALHESFLRGEYKCLELDEYAGLMRDFLKLLPRSIVIHRITGDPHKDEVVAPLWSLDKQSVRDEIERKLREGRNPEHG
jgi:radical SAM protein (TIGR01212 family)